MSWDRAAAFSTGRGTPHAGHGGGVRPRGRRHRGGAGGKQLGLPNVISFDMGGTTAKVSLIEGGEIKTTSEYEVGGGANARAG